MQVPGGFPGGATAGHPGGGPAREQHACVLQGHDRCGLGRQRGGVGAQRARHRQLRQRRARSAQGPAAQPGGPPEADHHPGRPARPRQDLPLQQAHVLPELVRARNPLWGSRELSFLANNWSCNWSSWIATRSLPSCHCWIQRTCPSLDRVMHSMLNGCLIGNNRSLLNLKGWGEINGIS